MSRWVRGSRGGSSEEREWGCPPSAQEGCALNPFEFTTSQSLLFLASRGPSGSLLAVGKMCWWGVNHTNAGIRVRVRGAGMLLGGRTEASDLSPHIWR